MSYYLKISTSNLLNLVAIDKLLVLFAIGSIKKINLPRRKKRFVFIKSPHVNNSSKEHFQIIKYQRLFFVNFSSCSLKLFLSKLPNSINIKLRKFYSAI
jgi:hypothetical protein